MDEHEVFYRRSLTHYSAVSRTFHADIYPAHDVAYIEVGLEAVRAADNIRVSYDFERDGYKIEQSRWTDENVLGTDWREVAFIPAWQLDERTEA